MTKPRDHSRGDELLERLRSQVATDEDDGSDGNCLLREFFRGYPLERLRELLESDNPTAVRTGAWIMSELGVQAAPIMASADRLLDHPEPGARFWTIDAVIVNASKDDGELVAKTLAVVDDPDERIRWKATWFTSWATIEQIGVGVPYLSGSVREAIVWLVNLGTDREMTAEVISRMEAPERTTRLVAAAAAARLAAKGQRSSLESAVSSTDPEVSVFAKDELDLLALRDRLEGERIARQHGRQ